MTRLASAALAAALLSSTTVMAAQITGGPSAQNVIFTAIPGGLLVTSDISGTNLDIYSATDTANAGAGGAWFLNLDFTTGHGIGGLYTADPNTLASFKYVAADGDTLIEQISATTVQDDTNQPKVYGTGVTTDISGDPAFLAAFGPIGTTDTWDFIVNDIGGHLDALTGSAGATLSSFEKIVTASPVAEPASLAMLISGLALMLAGYLTRQSRRLRPDEQMAASAR